jgi:hypothetical protein
MERSDITHLPCIVFLSRGGEQEAAWFLSANTERRPMRVVEKYSAMLMKGDPDAVKVQKLVLESGREVRSNASPTSISCVGALLRIVKRDEGAAIKIWPLVCQLCSGQPLHHVLVEGLHYIESRMSNGDSLAEPPYAQRVRSAGYDDLLRSAMEAAKYYSEGGAKVWATGLQKAINKRCRTNLLKVMGPDGP